MSVFPASRRNRLADESSPYLLQHAANPVDWFPWGEDALAKARSENKPIFLSIGYSACHWCHVMERESFENDEIAAFLNANFVNVKVDREERPDLDAIYMNAVVAMTGRGGWPMSVFLKPDGTPFFGGTYWPPHRRPGMSGFLDVLKHIHHAWTERQSEVEQAGESLRDALSVLGEQQGEPQPLGPESIRQAAAQLLNAADRKHGGFGRAPKFPHAMDLRVLLRADRRFDLAESREVVLHTLDAMARGGMYDQLGGGFHRYSTDATWLVPHFEKMLYDQALLVPVYVEGYQVSGRPLFVQVIRETLDYVLREMTDPAGGFYSAQDADSEGEEGKFFVWTTDEIEAVLGPENSQLFNMCYGVTPHGNWEEKNILHRPYSLEELATTTGMSVDAIEEVLEQGRAALLQRRSSRIAPQRDNKILTAWNGLMIAAFAMAGRALNDSGYLDAAERAAAFALETLHDGQQLHHQCMHGQARGTAFLDDYAALADGLAELFQATGNVRWLRGALSLCNTVRERFAHPAGGFYFTPTGHEELIVRARDTQDNATPSGNSLAAIALLKLARLTDHRDLEDAAIAALDSVSAQLVQSPLSSGQALLAVDFLLGPAREVVIVGPEAERAELLRAVNRTFCPNMVTLPWPPRIGATEETPAEIASVLAGKPLDLPNVYICERGACRAPTSNPAAVRQSLSY